MRKSKKIIVHQKKHDKEYQNATLRLLYERASCRQFSDQRIEPEILKKILKAGIHAPTGGNLQPYSIIKIEDADTTHRLAEMCGQKFIGEAPVNLLFCIDWHRLKQWSKIEKAPFSALGSFRHFWISFQDTIICAQNICTAADSLGLGSVYIGTIIEFLKETRDMFRLPKGVLPVVLLCLGYRKARPVVRRKLDVETIVHDERYHELKGHDLVTAYNEKYPNVRIEITEKRLARIKEVCNKVHGHEFAEKCLDKIEENGYISIAQQYFGLHYSADLLPDGNEDFLKSIEDCGFGWFKKYQLPKES